MVAAGATLTAGARIRKDEPPRRPATRNSPSSGGVDVTQNQGGAEDDHGFAYALTLPDHEKPSGNKRRRPKGAEPANLGVVNLGLIP
jgi:hypothetical protein